MLFSLLFIWGLIRKFSINSIEANSFILFWGIFILFNLPEISKKITSGTYLKEIRTNEIGYLSGIISPSIILANFKYDVKCEIGSFYELIHKNERLATGILIDDRIITGKRIVKISILSKESSFNKIASNNIYNILIKKLISDNNLKIEREPVSIVDKGTELGKLCFYLNPSINLTEGEIVWMSISNEIKGFYQIISATLISETEETNNYIYSIKVIAGQLGKWNANKSRFEPISWVPKAGETIFKCSEETIKVLELSKEQLLVGQVPNSPFPVHVNVQDTVTHNTAIIGVTGSGKSYLSFHIIEELAKNSIKIIILDLSRQHWIYLEKNNNLTALKTPADIDSWYNDPNSFIGIYQFANEIQSYPKATSEFVKKAFEKVSQITLRAGENEPAKLCIVFEEAHSLIPEWNQVSQQSDNQFVNQTSRFLLQGRKFGMGCIVITQRTANVTKTILNQCNSIFALQSFDQTGLDFLTNYMGSEYSNTICTLPKQHCILVGKSSSSARPILFKISDLNSKFSKTESEG